MERTRDPSDEQAAFSRTADKDELEVQVGYDEATRTYFVVSSDVPGLHIEAPSFEALVDIARDAAPDLISSPARDRTLTFKRKIDILPADGR